MRRYTRKLARVLTAAFVLSIFTPLLLCGGTSFTKVEASDCCRAMDSKCHKTNGDDPCCKHQSVAPLNLAISSAPQLAPPQALVAFSLLPVVLGTAPVSSQFHRQFFQFFHGHSPPEAVPLFLFHST